jgi:hypothetical protein
VSTGGRQRSEAEFRAIYDNAGFKLTRIVPMPARVFTSGTTLTSVLCLRGRSRSQLQGQ